MLLSNIPARKKIGNIDGEIISYKEAQRRVKLQPGNVLFMVEFDNDPIALDASVTVMSCGISITPANRMCICEELIAW